MILALLLGCGPTLQAFPPTPLHAIDAIPIAQGEVQTQLGGNFKLFPALIPDILGGSFSWDVGVGLGKRWELDLSMTSKTMSPNYGFRAGYTLLSDKKYVFGVIGGLGGSWNHVEGDSSIIVDGQTTTTHIDYSYATLAPWLGGRFVWKAAPFLNIPLIVRGGVSHLFPVAHLAESDAVTARYIDVQSGLIMPLGSAALGLDLGVGYYSDVGVPTPIFGRVGVSLQMKVGN
jgi:hypothetical protein